MTTVMFGLLTTGVIMKYRKATVTTNTYKLSDEEIELIEAQRDKKWESINKNWRVK